MNAESRASVGNLNKQALEATKSLLKVLTDAGAVMGRTEKK